MNTTIVVNAAENFPNRKLRTQTPSLVLTHRIPPKPQWHCFCSYSARLERADYCLETPKTQLLLFGKPNKSQLIARFVALHWRDFSLILTLIWNTCFGYHEKSRLGPSQHCWILRTKIESFISFLLFNIHQGVFSEWWQQWDHGQNASFWYLDGQPSIEATVILVVNLPSRRVFGLLQAAQ